MYVFLSALFNFECSSSNYSFFFYVFISIYNIFFFFFFSSRRRHTRYIGDWSSDVCSSRSVGILFVFLLMLAVFALNYREAEHNQEISRAKYEAAQEQARRAEERARRLRGLLEEAAAQLRSEERRVGKEVGSWWWGREVEGE